MGTASTTTATAIQNDPTMPCEMPARSGEPDSPASKNVSPRSLMTGMPSATTVVIRTPRMSREASRQATRTASNTRPRTSEREPRSAWATLPSTAPRLLRRVVSAMACPSVGLAHAAHEPVGDQIEAEGQSEEHDAHEVQAGDRQLADGPGGGEDERRHDAGHGSRQDHPEGGGDAPRAQSGRRLA